MIFLTVTCATLGGLTGFLISSILSLLRLLSIPGPAAPTGLDYLNVFSFPIFIVIGFALGARIGQKLGSLGVGLRGLVRMPYVLYPLLVALLILLVIGLRFMYTERENVRHAKYAETIKQNIQLTNQLLNSEWVEASPIDNSPKYSTLYFKDTKVNDSELHIYYDLEASRNGRVLKGSWTTYPEYGRLGLIVEREGFWQDESKYTVTVFGNELSLQQGSEEFKYVRKQ